MATINQIPMTLMGNLVSDLEPKRTAGGKTVVNFRVAQTSAAEKNGKWEDGETTFIRCVAYGILADHMIASGIRKGTRVIVSGRYVQRDWQTEMGGEAKQLRAQRGRSRRLRPLRHRPDHQGHRQRRHATRSAGPTATADGPANE